MLPPRSRSILAAAFVALSAVVTALSSTSTAPAQTAVDPCKPWPICNINHVVIIVQENRSFDHYFGTYTSPGGQPVDGIPRNPGGAFSVCVPNPVVHKCQKPYHSTNLYNVGAPHSHAASVAAVNHGEMNGFTRVALWAPKTAYCVQHWMSNSCGPLTGPAHQPDDISFHNRGEIPNYWAYADFGALQDRMFEPVDSWSLPAHLYLVSAWAANCTNYLNVNSCHSDPQAHNAYNYPWADITHLLRNQGISWDYFVGDGTDLNCMGKPTAIPAPATRQRSACNPTNDPDASSTGWLPILWFQSVQDAHDKGNVKHLSDFFTQIEAGTMADVTWFVPPARWSEHPGHAAIRPGERYVTNLVNTIGQSPFWNDTAIFITWDDWGGFYDHVSPPNIDGMGYGIRVPGIMISPYAKTSYVDHQTLSFDAYLKFIEDRFLGGARLDPATDGWPDPRPTVREDVVQLGDLLNEFDFTQPPRPAPILELPHAGPAGWPYPETRQVGFGGE